MKDNNDCPGGMEKIMADRRKRAEAMGRGQFDYDPSRTDKDEPLKDTAQEATKRRANLPKTPVAR